MPSPSCPPRRRPRARLMHILCWGASRKSRNAICLGSRPAAPGQSGAAAGAASEMKGAPDARQIQLQPVGNVGAASLWINEPPYKHPHPTNSPPTAPSPTPSLGCGPTICMAPAKLIIHARFQSKCHALIDGRLNKRACVCMRVRSEPAHNAISSFPYVCMDLGRRHLQPPHPLPAGRAPSIASSQPITLTDTLVESTPWLLTRPTVIFMFMPGAESR